MNGLEILGAVGAASLRERLKALVDSEGIARFMLDQLTGQQVAAIVKAVLADKDTAAKIAIRVPRNLVAGFDVPAEVTTDERTVALRHAEWDLPALLLANTDDDQGASLQDVTLLGAKQLTEEPKLWVQAASAGIGLPEEHKSIWEAALRGLAASDDWTLHQVSNYVELTRIAVADESKPILEALGWALPALHLPRHSGYFLAGQQKGLTSTSRWKKNFDKLISDRRPLLVKQRPPRQIIESEELRSQFANVREDIPVHAHPAIEAFVRSPPSWGDESAALAEFEWEVDNILLVFSGLRQRKVHLFQETSEFFEFEMPDRLSDVEKLYLSEATSRKEPRDDDRDFFEAHRDDIGKDRSLRAKWERFVFGRPIECTDFLEGLLRALERLYGQAGALQANRSLEIRTGKRTKNQWLELNGDVATSFAVRYRGLPALMGDKVKWDTSHLFEYQALLEAASKRKGYKRNVSTSRTSLQIRLDITLKIGADRTTVQLIWMGRPDAIGLELRDDLERLARRPLVRSTVSRQPVSRKGGLQSISLSDVSTLQPAFRQDSGSLIPRLDGGDDVSKSFPKNLKAALAAGRLTAAGLAAIETAWKAFSEAYSAAIKGLRTDGLASGYLLEQSESYGDLLRTLAQHAAGDLNRRELWEPVLALGCVPVTGGAPSAIVAPWHPLRLAAMSVKARCVAGLTAHLLNADDVIFGDPRLFFADLRDELAHAYYPEIAIAHQGAEPVLVTETGTLNDYSLLERPIRDPSESSTDVDPAEAARQIRALLERYLDLQPHERSNLSIMLYNCDAAGLPIATVNALGSVHDEDEMHCNVLVRHRDRKKLSKVYGELLERPEGDPDTLVVSETSRNFMSKLRIGVMLDGGGAAAEKHSVDVAFLHDVVSRQAKQEWFSIPAPATLPDILDHVPARWSYRRVTAEDELKATSYLVCPRQPAAGWAYLDAVAAVVRQRSGPANEHMVPAREISFQEQNLKAMFDEVHGLAEWVATYDDLLDKRQLMAQGISVIRYRRQRTHGRNMIVSSTSELRLLHVLVKRRLNELSLGCSEDQLSVLAQRMIDDACGISGDIVLRAARRGVSAGELIGLVLSRALVAEEFGTQASVAWFLLDDYAEWLGQREQGIADILALSVGTGADGRPTLRAVVTEAKYVSAETSADARRSSKQQLRQTVQRIEDALFGDPGRLDRDLWLSRISDLLLDGTTALGQSLALEAVRDGMRKGAIPIDLRGYSHVFVHGPTDSTVAGEQELIPDVPNGIQEIFGREDLRKLVNAYEARSPLSVARQALGADQPWTNEKFREPAPRVSWTNKTIASTASTPDPDVKPQPPTGPAPDSRSVGAPSIGGQPGGTKPAGAIAPASSIATPPSPDEAVLEDKVVSQGPMDILSLIESHTREQSSTTLADQAWLDATAQKLRTALLGYGLQAKIAGTRLTPNAALIRFFGSDRLRMEDIQNRESALLTTHGLRLVAVSPLPGEIVVAVARQQRQIVSLWEVWGRRELNRNAAGQNTSFVLGLRELDGEILYLNLGTAFGGAQSHDPHTLVAGATGSGKSVLIQAIILDIAATNPSSLAQIILIDPKMGVDYAAIERLPHIIGGIVIDQGRAQTELESLIDEMERRYELFRASGARDLRSFNAAKHAPERLPLLFLVHDEFAEWMLTETYKDAVATTVQRLGVKARAAGIHLIFAAQRPDANVMPMQLRDNLGNRLILKVASVGTSEIALGIKGAESLLGLGHLAARLTGEAGVVFAQAPFLSDADIERAVDAIIYGDRPIAGLAAE
ncbi:S-DNA-T family DNA segregation ATPase FtsK/SpoIIIE [Nitrobacteraceae bacterium AZCC 2146]